MRALDAESAQVAEKARELGRPIPAVMAPDGTVVLTGGAHDVEGVWGQRQDWSADPSGYVNPKTGEWMTRDEGAAFTRQRLADTGANFNGPQNGLGEASVMHGALNAADRAAAERAAAPPLPLLDETPAQAAKVPETISRRVQNARDKLTIAMRGDIPGVDAGDAPFAMPPIRDLMTPGTPGFAALANWHYEQWKALRALGSDRTPQQTKDMEQLFNILLQQQAASNATGAVSPLGYPETWSRLTRAVEESTLKSGTKEEWLAVLRAAPGGVNESEIRSVLEQPGSPAGEIEGTGTGVHTLDLSQVKGAWKQVVPEHEWSQLKDVIEANPGWSDRQMERYIRLGWASYFDPSDSRSRTRQSRTRSRRCTLTASFKARRSRRPAQSRSSGKTR